MARERGAGRPARTPNPTIKPGARPQELARLAMRVRNIGQHHAALQRVVTNLGGRFAEAGRWEQLYGTGDIDDTITVNTVRGSYEPLVMALAEAITTAAILTSAWPKGRPRTEDAIEAAFGDGAFSKPQSQVLHRHVVMRGRLAHVSPDVQASEIREHVLDHTPGLSNALAAWLKREAVVDLT